MDIEKLKKEFIKLKKEELAYLDNIAKLGYQKTFSLQPDNCQMWGDNRDDHASDS